MVPFKTTSIIACCLSQHVLWQRPDNADRIGDWVLSQLSADDGTKQVCVHGGVGIGLTTLLLEAIVVLSSMLRIISLTSETCVFHTKSCHSIISP